MTDDEHGIAGPPDWSDTCHECGSAPKHEDCGDWCRRCSNKNNSGSRDYTTIIDHDRLRAKLGRELAAEVLIECFAEWRDTRR